MQYFRLIKQRILLFLLTRLKSVTCFTESRFLVRLRPEPAGLKFTYANCERARWLKPAPPGQVKVLFQTPDLVEI